MLQFLIYYLIKRHNGELPSQRAGLSKSQVIAQQLEQKIIQLGDMSRLSRDEIIKELGQPNKLKTLKDGNHCLVWK